MKLAYFSPMPPERSGIADYSALLVPALRERMEVDVIRRGRKRGGRGADVALYHVGNNPESHGWIVEALRRRPGVVVLHDFVLHHLVSGMTLGRGNAGAYLDAMERDAGVVGRLLAHGVIEHRIPPLWESRAQDFALSGEVLSLATGLIVHSHYVERRAREAGYERPIAVVPHPAFPVPVFEPEPVAGDPVFGCFGNVNASKRIPQLLEAFARVRRTSPGARLLLVGAISPGFDLDRRLQRLGLEGEGIERIGYVDEGRLWSLMAACDAIVALRAPTMGETSGSAIRALSLGKPLVVSDIGWFAELPDSVALKVPVDESERDVLTAALGLLAADPVVRASMSKAALATTRVDHDLDRVADGYAAAIELAAGGSAVGEAVLREIAGRAAEVGIDPDAADTAELARRLREVGLGD